MQKRSQKSQSLRDRQRNHLKSARECEEEMQKLGKEMEERKTLYETRFRALSEKSTVEKPQQSWKMRSRPCRQVKKEEVAVRLSPMDAALIQPHWSRSSLLEKYGQQVLSNLCCKSLSGSTELPTLRAVSRRRRDRRWERDWDDEKEQSGWYESAAEDPGVDSDRCQDANGGSGGGGNPSTPRDGLHARDSSRSPRGQRNKMEEDEHL